MIGSPRVMSGDKKQNDAIDNKGAMYNTPNKSQASSSNILDLKLPLISPTSSVNLTQYSNKEP